jgi:molybdopterin-guanine dinucleotide biosynthesis protein A
MQRAGFILTGGRSSRMRTDKALLPWRGRTVVEYMAAAVKSVAGSCTLVGAPEKYSFVDIPCVADLRPGLGPLSGLEAALSTTAADWNLILACDFPEITSQLLASLFDHALSAGNDVTLTVGTDGKPQPLCAVYHRGCLASVRDALDRHELRLLDVVSHLNPAFFSASSPLYNVNTPEEWRNALLR